MSHDHAPHDHAPHDHASPDHASHGLDHGHADSTPDDAPRYRHGQGIDPYAEGEPMWSGNPNAALITEVSALGAARGRALDIGCGEGADAVWLAQQGWDVTGVDISAIALGRARAAATAADVSVTWIEAPLAAANLPVGGFDLVTAMYPALVRTDELDIQALILALVAPGGTLLFVHHGEIDRDRAREHGFDPDTLVMPPDMLAAALADVNINAGGPGESPDQTTPRWRVDTNAERERHVSSGAGAHHQVDVILRLHRLHRLHRLPRVDVGARA